jgi:nicotinate dehydrogenase subunit A
MRSCVTAIGTLGQAEITTLEGLGTIERPHPLQAAFMAEQAAQCGYCIPGMIMLAKALLDRNQQPSEAEVRLGLAGNLCRCGAHNRIVRAILKAAEAGGRI